MVRTVSRRSALTALTVVPERRAGKARLGILGGGRDPDGAFTFTWPLWRDPISLVTIRALLGHPGLDNPTTRAELGIVDRLRTRRVSFGRYMNFTRAESAIGSMQLPKRVVRDRPEP